MSDVRDVGEIDLVATGPTGRLTLVIVEPRLWGSDPAQPEQLRQKLNAYVGFIETGQAAAAVPEAAAVGVDILVQCLDEPSEDIAGMLLTAQDGLSERGVGLYYNTVDPEDVPSG